MALLSFVLMFVIAGVCGLVAGNLMGARKTHFVWLIVFGFAGAWLGKWIQGFLHLPTILPISTGGMVFPLVWTVLGAVIIVAIVSAFRQH